MDDALKRMAKVQDRLDALKMEIVPKFRETDLYKLMKNECRKLEKRLQHLEVKVSCEVPVQVKTDPELMVQIIENILLNALEAGGTVAKIRLYYEDGSHAVMKIWNNGPAIPQNMLSGRIFEPFKTAKAGGSGIGMWQAKRLITIFGGDISAGNAEGGGVWFRISLHVSRLLANGSNPA